MRFMIIVKATKASEAGVMPRQELFDRMDAYHDELARAGVLLDGAGLKATSHGWRVHYQDGERTGVMDGPFTESKELVAGYTLIQTKTREEALEWTRRFPAPFEDGTCHIEVRQLFEPEDFEQGVAG